MYPKKISTGIDGLDPLIGGGFLRGSLIILAGNPGTGKTIFSAQFLHRGAAEYGENGIYVSFAESRETFYGNMKTYGWDFEELEKEGKFKFLDMVTGRETLLPAILERIVDEVHRMEAKRLVIDSFSAMAQAFEKPIDARIIVHTLLSKVIRQEGCTTIIIEEIPYGEKKIGLGMEEFVADGVVLLERNYFDKMLLREISILKLRGREVIYPTLAFSLKGGFNVFQPLIMEETKQPTGKYEVILHSKDYLSTGIRELDQVLMGGFRRGSYDVFEVDIDVAYPLENLCIPIICNSLNQNSSVAIIPPQGVSIRTIKGALAPYISEQLLRRNLRVAEYITEGNNQPEDQYVIPLRGKSIEEDMEIFWNVTSELRRNTTKPVLTLVGFDTIEYIYGKREALKILGEDIMRIRNFGDVRLNIIRPSIDIADTLRAVARTHIKVVQINGALFLYGIKPKTPLYHTKLTKKEGVLKIKLVPIV